MPGASHHVAVEVAFAKRSTTMQADVVNRVELAAHIEQGHRRLADLDRFAGSCGDIRHLCNFDEIAHDNYLSARADSIDTPSSAATRLQVVYSAFILT